MDESALATKIPDPFEVDAIVTRAKAVYQRTLASWATDLLMLRHAGKVEPRWLDGSKEDVWRHAA